MSSELKQMMTITEAQADMRQGYLGGGPGALVSGAVWLIAGIVALVVSEQASVFTLFFGGMTIFPLGTVLAKALGRSGEHSKGNQLSNLAIETTFLLFIGLFIAFAVVQIQSQWFFPIMLMIIGARYLMFATIYGMRLYWVFGGILAVAGGILLFLNAPFVVGAFLGAGVEIVFGIAIIFMMRSQTASATSN